MSPGPDVSKIVKGTPSELVTIPKKNTPPLLTSSIYWDGLNVDGARQLAHVCKLVAEHLERGGGGKKKMGVRVGSGALFLASDNNSHLCT
jgi:hypothetical protein